MIKGIRIVMVIIMIASVFTGCSSSKANTSSKKDEVKATPDSKGDNRQRNFQRPDLMGEVTEIVGNEVTLKLIEMPQFNPSATGRPSGRPNRDSNNGNDGQERPQGENGQRPGRAIKYTGETKAITIPAGIPITSMIRGNFGGQRQPGEARPTPEIKQMELKDIKKGVTLQIFYADKDKGIISRINLQQARPQGQQGGPQGGQ